jgi:glutaredoxin-like protein
MAMLSDNDANEVRKIFGALVRDVHVKVYTRKLECPTCQDTETILKELDQLSDRLIVTFLNPETDREEAEMDGVDVAPVIVVSDGSHSRIKFMGTPSGYEFSSLLTVIVDAGGEEEPLAAESVEFLDGLEEDLKVQVFVTPTCPHCPSAAVLACRMARYSDKVAAEVIEANEFGELSRRFRVQGVPRTVINGKFFAEGALPESMVVSALKAGLEEAPSGEKNLMEYIQTG